MMQLDRSHHTFSLNSIDNNFKIWKKLMSEQKIRLSRYINRFSVHWKYISKVITPILTSLLTRIVNTKIGKGK